MFEWIKAKVFLELGELTIRYKLVGMDEIGGNYHDGNVTDYTDDQIKDLVMKILGVGRLQRDLIQVIWK